MTAKNSKANNYFFVFQSNMLYLHLKQRKNGLFLVTKCNKHLYNFKTFKFAQIKLYTLRIHT